MLVEGAQAGATSPACFVSLSGADGDKQSELLLLKEPTGALPGAIYGDALASYAEPLRPSSDSSSSSEHPSPRPASLLLMEEPQRGPSAHDGADASTSGATENVPVFVMLPLDTVSLRVCVRGVGEAPAAGAAQRRAERRRRRCHRRRRSQTHAHTNPLKTPTLL